jgi:hypothetical protein
MEAPFDSFKQSFHENVRHGTDRTSLLPTKTGGFFCWGGGEEGGGGSESRAKKNDSATRAKGERKESESGAKRVQTRANGVRIERTTT